MTDWNTTYCRLATSIVFFQRVYISISARAPKDNFNLYTIVVMCNIIYSGLALQKYTTIRTLADKTQRKLMTKISNICLYMRILNIYALSFQAESFPAESSMFIYPKILGYLYLFIYEQRYLPKLTSYVFYFKF